MKKALFVSLALVLVLATSLAWAGSLTLRPGQSHTFVNRTPMGYLSVTNESGSHGSFSLSYGGGKAAPGPQNERIGGFATHNMVPRAWPVTITNTGRIMLMISY
jgi:hypothetical protein